VRTVDFSSDCPGRLVEIPPAYRVHWLLIHRTSSRINQGKQDPLGLRNVDYLPETRFEDWQSVGELRHASGVPTCPMVLRPRRAKNRAVQRRDEARLCRVGSRIEAFGR